MEHYVRCSITRRHMRLLWYGHFHSSTIGLSVGTPDSVSDQNHSLFGRGSTKARQM